MNEEKEKFLKEIKHKFEESKKELNFKTTYKELDEIFFITDYLMSEGYISENFSRQICSRIRDTLNVWANYLHSLLLPNPSYMMNMTEAKLFGEEDKKEIWDLMKKSLALSSQNAIVGLSKDKKLEAEFIDSSVKFWKEKYQPNLLKIMKKVNKAWNE